MKSVMLSVRRFIAMEYLGWYDLLRQRIAKGPMRCFKCWTFASTSMTRRRGHGHGIIHRRFKPGKYVYHRGAASQGLDRSGNRSQVSEAGEWSVAHIRGRTRNRGESNRPASVWAPYLICLGAALGQPLDVR